MCKPKRAEVGLHHDHWWTLAAVIWQAKFHRFSVGNAVTLGFSGLSFTSQDSYTAIGAIVAGLVTLVGMLRKEKRQDVAVGDTQKEVDRLKAQIAEQVSKIDSLEELNSHYQRNMGRLAYLEEQSRSQHLDIEQVRHVAQNTAAEQKGVNAVYQERLASKADMSDQQEVNVDIDKRLTAIEVDSALNRKKADETPTTIPAEPAPPEQQSDHADPDQGTGNGIETG
jgi:hypothetical protein